ncbi:MAG TPA: CHRD domain-containing protein [Cyclobacteriaceae bacterium]|nr:CHRD domain-containing protein [Cyclobacteriaceae bacterium]
MLYKFRAISIVLALVSAGFVMSCDDDDDNPGQTTTYNATMNGTSETPPNATTATGTAVLTFDNTTKIFTMTVNYTGLSGAATAAHIHKGAVGVAGDPVFPISGSLTSPITLTSVALTAAQEADLKAGMYYVNVHTAAYPGGEIRGQLTN